MADLKHLVNQLSILERLESIGRPLPDDYKRNYLEHLRTEYGDKLLDLFNEHPSLSTSFLQRESEQKENRRRTVEERPKRRPTGKPLIAIGMDRRIAVPTEALAAYRKRQQPGISVSTVIIPDKKVVEGTLIRGTTIAWAQIAETLQGNWSLAFKIPPEKWEEIIAGAYERAGYDQVILTPRSGDYGRDVIAIKSGFGCIKVVGSVKDYAPGNLVKHDDVRALLGVMSGEQDVSKGIITTTSDFAPRIVSDPFIKPFLPTRLELMNGDRLQQWLSSLIRNSGRR